MSENIEEKYTCSICGFESNGPGECPTDDEVLQRVCDCGSDKYATECCSAPQKDESEEAVAAEVKAEDMEERLGEAEIVVDENEDEVS